RRISTQQQLWEYVHLSAHIQNVVLQQGVRDTIIWRWTPNGSYTTSSAYKAQFHGSQPLFSSAVLWKAKAEPKVQDPQDQGVAEWLKLNTRTFSRQQRRHATGILLYTWWNIWKEIGESLRASKRTAIG
ncbi:hypothetical protein EJB05_40493, partial [Eragrostis curvula]